jgi:signal transduction histidine kinase
MAKASRCLQIRVKTSPNAISPIDDAAAKWRQHAEDLAQSNLRLEEFAYNAAHDLREPLRTISLFTSLLAQETQLDARTRQMAGFIVDGAARMSVLVEDLLSFARTGIPAPHKRVDLRDAVGQAVQNLAVEIGTSGAIVKVGQLPVVSTNEIQVIRLFQNLISNAVKYRREEPLEIDVAAERRGPDWVVRIADNGLGIAPDDQARVFLPFVRLASRDVPGTGLGLAVCSKIVEGLGGTIWVDSAPGAGSTFCFTLAAN